MTPIIVNQIQTCLAPQFEFTKRSILSYACECAGVAAFHVGLPRRHLRQVAAGVPQQAPPHVGVLASRGRKLPNQICANCIITPSNTNFFFTGLISSPPHFTPHKCQNIAAKPRPLPPRAHRPLSAALPVLSSAASTSAAGVQAPREDGQVEVRWDDWSTSAVGALPGPCCDQTTRVTASP